MREGIASMLSDKSSASKDTLQRPATVSEDSTYWLECTSGLPLPEVWCQNADDGENLETTCQHQEA